MQRTQLLSTHRYVVFFNQIQYFYSMQQYESCVRDFLVPLSLFVREKVFINKNLRIIHHALRISVPDCFIAPINRKSADEVIIRRHDVIVNFFDVVLFFLSGLVICSSFMSILLLVPESRRFLFIRDLTRNPENGNAPCLSFVQYLETGVSQGYQLWQGCL